MLGSVDPLLTCHLPAWLVPACRGGSQLLVSARPVVSCHPQQLPGSQENEDFLSSLLGSGDSVSDSSAWSPAASDSGISEDPTSDQLDSPPGYVPGSSPGGYSDGGHGEPMYSYQDSCQALPVLKVPVADLRDTEVSIDLGGFSPRVRVQGELEGGGAGGMELGWGGGSCEIWGPPCHLD